MWFPKRVAIAEAVTLGKEPERLANLEGSLYAEACERWLDFWGRGAAQRKHLKDNIVARSGTVKDPSTSGSESNYAGDGDESVESGTYLSEDGRAVRDETTELVTCGFASRIAKDLGVLYSSDDLERRYRTGDGRADKTTSEILAWYDHPDRGGLEAHMHLIDAHLVGLRVMGTLVSWIDDIGEVSYEAIFPHWMSVLQHDRHKSRIDLAYAIGYRETTKVKRDGVDTEEDVWTVYVRPPLPSDPDSAPTWHAGPQGRVVRYSLGSQIAADGPWPVPDRGDARIIDDRPNEIAKAGWAAHHLWSPIVLHYAEPPTEHWRLPVADHLARANEELDIALTDALYTAATQLYGQPVFTGAGTPPKRLGRNNVVHVIDAAGSFTYAATGAKPLEHLETARKIAQLLGVFEGVPSDTFLDQPPSIETGPAKLLRRAELIMERSKRTLMAEAAEQKIFKLKRLYHNTWGRKAPWRPAGVTVDLKAQIPEETTLTMRWGELVTPVQWAERLAEMKLERELKLSTTEEQIAERHGVSIEEAKIRLSEIDEMTSDTQVETTPEPPAPAQPSEGMPPLTPGIGQGDEEIDGTQE